METSSTSFDSSAVILVIAGLLVVAVALLNGIRDRRAVADTGELYHTEEPTDSISHRRGGAAVDAAVALSTFLVAGAFVCRAIVAGGARLLQGHPGSGTLAKAGSWFDRLWVTLEIPFTDWTIRIHWGVLAAAIFIIVMPLIHRAKLRGYLVAAFIASALVAINVALAALAHRLGTPMQYLGG